MLDRILLVLRRNLHGHSGTYQNYDITTSHAEAFTDLIANQSFVPVAAWPECRKVFGYLPWPHSLIEPKSLYQDSSVLQAVIPSRGEGD